MKKFSLKVVISTTVLTSFVVGMLSVGITSSVLNLQRVDFCQYAAKFSASQNDIMVSQKSGYNNLELIQCDGTAKIIRDDKNQVQNFTIFFPQNEYNVHVSSVDRLTNVSFIRAGDSVPSSTPGKIVNKQNINL